MYRARSIVFAAAVALVAAACTPSSSEPTTSAGVQSTSTTAASPAPQRLATLDQDGAVVIVTASGEVVERLSPPPDTQYVQPVWLSRGAILTAQVGADANSLKTVDVEGNVVWEVEMSTAPFYFLPSTSDDGVRVLSLRNNDQAAGLISEIVDVDGAATRIGEESPFYGSWEPGTDRLATHVADERLDVLTADSATISSAAQGFQAPVWLDVGLVTVRRSGSDAFVSIWDGRQFTDLVAIDGPARFVAAGRSIAIQTGGQQATGGVQALAQAAPEVRPGVLTVVDAVDGSTTTVTGLPSPIFQWDPSGTRLLFATIDLDPDPLLIWHVWEDGTVRDFSAFSPDPRWFQTVIPFFDQYAQSVAMWSPDGAAFAYPATVDDEPRIFVQPLTSDTPRDIGSGIWVSWEP